MGESGAKKVIMEEKKKCLAELTAEESLLEYDALCRTWEMNKEEVCKLGEERVSFFIKKRELFNKIGSFRRR